MADSGRRLVTMGGRPARKPRARFSEPMRPLEQIRVYRYGPRAMLVVSDRGTDVYNTETGSFWPGVRGIFPNRGRPVLQVRGSGAVGAIHALQYWYGFRLFVPLRRMGKVTVFRQSDDLAVIVPHVSRRAEDLERGDEHDWIRGHEAFEGPGLAEGAWLLHHGLSSDDPRLRDQAAQGLIDLYTHTRHKCFSSTGLLALSQVYKQLVQDLNVKPRHDVQQRLDRVIQVANERRAYWDTRGGRAPKNWRW